MLNKSIGIENIVLLIPWIQEKKNVVIVNRVIKRIDLLVIWLWIIDRVLPISKIIYETV